MTYNFDNINEFFEDLMNSKNAKFNMLHVYGAYERECEAIKEIQDVEKEYKWPGSYYMAHKVNDDIYIVTEMNKGLVTGYFAHVNGKKSHYLWPTFEKALLCAVSIKLTGREDATEWMWKLVGVENNS